MHKDILRVFEDLPEDMQARCLQRFSINREDLNRTQTGNQPTSLKRAREALNTINALSDTDAQPLVKDALIAMGWTVEDFLQSDSAVARAGALYLLDSAAAEDTVRWWFANKGYWSSTRMSSFRAPVGDLFDESDLEQAANRHDLIRSVVGQHYPTEDVIDIRWRFRPSDGVSFLPGSLIQVDIKRSKDPETVEVNEDGKATQLTLRFLASISIVIDPHRGEIAVIADRAKRDFKPHLAAVVQQILFSKGGAPVPTPPLQVHLDILGTETDLAWDPNDRIDGMRVIGLGFRRSGSHGIRIELKTDGDSNLYDAPELTTLQGPVTIFRAFIEFRFKGDLPTSAERQRVAQLVAPHAMSFPYFTHEERLIAQNALVLNDLLDAPTDAAPQLALDELERLVQPTLLEEVKAILGAALVAALVTERIFKEAAPARSAWCPACIRNHPVVEDIGGKLRLDCRRGHSVDVTDDDLRTIRFDADALAAWLARSVGTDVSTPAKIDSHIWNLGEFQSQPGNPGLGLLLATGLQAGPQLQSLTRYLISQRKQRPGLVIAVDGRHLDTSLDAGWKLAQLSFSTSLNNDRLSCNAETLADIFRGRVNPKPRVKMDWEDFFTQYEQHHLGRGPYIEADNLRERFPDRWPNGRASLATRLKERYPEHFK